MRYLNIILLVLIAGLTACEKEIPYDDIAPEPLLAVNGLQHVGEPARLCVEKSSFYVGTESDFRVKDVTVDLYVNGVFKESLRVWDSCYYETYENWQTGEIYQRLRYAFTYCEGDYLLGEGDALHFEVHTPEFEETAVAETTMPTTPNLIRFDTIRVEEDTYGDKTIFFALEIDDPAGKDYYNLHPGEGLDGFVSSDPVFSDFMNIVHVDDLFGNSDYYGRGTYNLFNDAYFDGTRYTVTLKTRWYAYDSEYYEPYVASLSKVDDGFYQYMKSYNIYHNADSQELLGWFTEPAQVYSNVQHGVGVVSAQGREVTMTIDLMDLK